MSLDSPRYQVFIPYRAALLGTVGLAVSCWGHASILLSSRSVIIKALAHLQVVRASNTVGPALLLKLKSGAHRMNHKTKCCEGVSRCLQGANNERRVTIPDT
jgi:hypothetical protein